ncbi:MAG: LuxR C-terminal-related transcriptional regulator [Burkholderiaceae bacterium]
MMRTNAAGKGARDRLAELAHAADVLSDPERVVALAVEALKDVCPRGKALGFTRMPDGSIGVAAAMIHGRVVSMTRPPPSAPMPWIVNLDRVPAWQRDRWIEPIRQRVHGPAFFSCDNPVMRMIGETEPPEYGRMMLCQDQRLLAWVGLYVDAKHAFDEREREALAEVSTYLRQPLRIATALQARSPRISLAPRQHEIVERVARGWTNKQIAKDLDISPATVKTLLERLFRVSGSGNRAALVQWLHDGTRAGRRP